MKTIFQLFILIFLICCLSTSRADSWETGKKLYDLDKYRQAYPYLNKAASSGNPKGFICFGTNVSFRLWR